MSEKTLPIEILGDIAVLRPRGRIPLERLIPRVTATIKAVRDRGIRKLLLVALELEGLQSPGIGTRFFLSRQWAIAAGGAVRMAIAVGADLIDPQKFGVLVARNFGATANVFATEAEALAWLQDGV